MTGIRLILRLHRRSVVALIIFAAAVGALQASGFAEIAGDTAAERAAFGRESLALAQQVAFLVPPPTDLSTLGGYITWRVFGSLPLMLGLWAIWFAAATTRGDESAGRTDQLLASGSSRRGLVGRSAGAFFLASLAVVTTLCLSLRFGASAGTAGSLPWGHLALQGLALACVLVFAFGVGAVTAQVTASVRSAFAVGAIVIFVLNAVSALGGTESGLGNFRRLSPFSWYSASEPLAPGGHFFVTDCIALVALGAGLVLVAALLFTRRDLGHGIIRARFGRKDPRRPFRERWIRHPRLASVYEHRRALGWWLFGTLALVAFFTSLAPSMVDALQQVRSLDAYLRQISGGEVERGVIGLFLFGTLQLLLAMFAISYVARWARDDQEGRLELELSAPITRTAVVLRRASFIAVATGGIATIALGFLILMAAQEGIEIGLGSALRTLVVLIPFTLAFAAVGAVLTAWAPRGAVLGLVAFTVVSYFIKETGPIYGWPEWILELSVFEIAGNPLVENVGPTPILALVAVALCAFGAATLLMRRRDVAS